MSAPPHVSQEASPFKDVLIVALTLTTVALVLAVWQQRAEIRRLAPLRGEPLGPGLAVRHATARNFLLTPPASGRPAEDAGQSRDETEQRAPAPFSSVARTRTVNASPLARLLDNPEFFQALSLQRQATLDARFAGLFRRLDLGASELAAFKRLLAEKENVALDVVAVSEAQPDGPLPAGTLQAGVGAARARVEDAIRDSLGSERYEVYRDYVQTLPQRTVVAQLEQRLSYSPTPLSPTQAESLVRILVAHAPPSPPVETGRPTTVVVDATAPVATPLGETRAPVAIVNNAVLTDAQTLLTPNQIGALREIQTEQQASTRALQLIRDTLPGENALNALRTLLWQ